MTSQESPAQDLSAQDLANYTRGRLNASDQNTQDVLDAALQEIRSYCRWHVAPVMTEMDMTFDGPGDWGGLAVGIGGIYYASGSYLTGVLRRARCGAETLYLPTKRLLSVTKISEDGIELDVENDIAWSRDGRVQKTCGRRWTSNFRGISVSFEHGYTRKEAADWNRIVLNAADRMSLVRGLVGPFPVSIGPYRLGGYYGTSRAGNMPGNASWLDDLTALIDVTRYVRIDV